jgi:hypothetical protein
VAPGASGVLTLPFAAVAGAGGYEAEVARDAAFEDIVAHVALGAAQTTLTSPPLPAGRYFARLSARSPDGVRGLPSATRALRVARVDLPKGGALIRGLVVLPPNRTFTWDDPSGLEISNGPAGFAPAPRELGLSGGDQPSTLLVRLAGQRSALPLTIAPLTMRAEIDLGPKTATWPSDPVQIAVRVVAPGGTTLDYEPSLRVTVNLDVVSVRWERRGSGYRATLPPRTDGGPWIVRVEALDQRGKELGFGALEVIRSRPGRTAFGDRRR